MKNNPPEIGLALSHFREINDSPFMWAKFYADQNSVELEVGYKNTLSGNKELVVNRRIYYINSAGHATYTVAGGL